MNAVEISTLSVIKNVVVLFSTSLDSKEQDQVSVPCTLKDDRKECCGYRRAAVPQGVMVNEKKERVQTITSSIASHLHPG